MSDCRKLKVRGDWADAAYHLIATGLTTQLAVDLRITNSGLDLPDAALDDLCDAIMGDVGPALALVEGYEVPTP